MKYNKEVTLKDGRTLQMRSGTEKDGQIVYEIFTQTHSETDYLLTYPEENTLDAVKEAAFLVQQENSANAVEILGFLDGRLVGIAGIDGVCSKYKLQHRADFGISILKEFWGLGIGRVMTQACIDCARQAGYSQLELTAVYENKAAVKLYESLGFVEYGRNPRGFLSKFTGFQETIHMRMEL